LSSELDSSIWNKLDYILKHSQAVEIFPETYHEGDVYCLYDKAQLDSFSAQMLDPEFWQKQNLVVSQARGRGITWFVVYLGNEMALRHYYRGGLVGKLINDAYWFNSHATTRAVAEFNLLKKLSALGLPVPQPVACRVIKSTFFYTADLLTARIKDSQDLVTLLCKAQLNSDVWQNIGATIKAFHQQGVFHHDLNAHNILIDKNAKVWLIDFDKGKQRSANKTWQNKNLARLKRSLLKEQQNLANFYFQEADFEELLNGYESA